MPNRADTADQLNRFFMARVPVVIVRTSEYARAIDLVSETAQRFGQMSFYLHSRAKGLSEVGSNVPVNDDRSFVGALDFATSTFLGRAYANFIFADLDDIEDDSATARHLAEMARLAEERQGSLILISDKPVWSGLARLGMAVTLDLPEQDELHFLVDSLVNEHRGSNIVIEWQHDEVRRAAEILVGVAETEAVNMVTTLLAKGSLEVRDVEQLSQYKDMIFGDRSGIERVLLNESDYQVGGLSNLRAWLAKRSVMIRADLTGTKVRPPRGVLLVGVPGCGKSLSAKAIAAEWHLPLYRLDMASILGMYVGVSENRLKEALETADLVSPCVLWIDEIEKAFAGGSGDSGTTRRMIGQFLFWLQESTSKVFLVATANDVSSLPPELLRKGRFDEMFFVDLPDADDRREILTLSFARYLRTEPSPFVLDDLVEATEGFAGSDIDAVMNDIGASVVIGELDPRDEVAIKSAFVGVVPFSRSNPEDVEAIRAWGRERAKPAGRVAEGQGFAPPHGHGRRVVLSH
ncbi:MAG: AAA family ATPase [Gordonia sp. (in: high G+C Gram-positive bacteria)]|uniref:AAA family ATPase n=1 Tax=Gordonia sp. (in: high G+C Gram-positive bacteria) TaxID=84139 RepID=UPI003C763AD2